MNHRRLSGDMQGARAEARAAEGDYPGCFVEVAAECALLCNNTWPLTSAPTALAEILMKVRLLVRDLGVEFSDDDADFAQAVQKARAIVAAK